MGVRTIGGKEDSGDSREKAVEEMNVLGQTLMVVLLRRSGGWA